MLVLLVDFAFLRVMTGLFQNGCHENVILVILIAAMNFKIYFGYFYGSHFEKDLSSPLNVAYLLGNYEYCHKYKLKVIIIPNLNSCFSMCSTIEIMLACAPGMCRSIDPGIFEDGGSLNCGS